MKLTNISVKDGTASYGDKLYFFRSRFKDNTVLAFYTMNPGGHTEDQERGWAVLHLKKRAVLSGIDTYYYGPCNMRGEFAKWRKEQTEIHGPTKHVWRTEDGRLMWVMNE